jgi:DtxR family Mn-dependent transcriptional regulator
MEVLFDLQISLCETSYMKMKLILERVPNISKTQLTNIVQRKLEKLGYVHYTPYEGVKLTSTGFKVAQKIARNHRIRFLIRWLSIFTMLYQKKKLPLEF